MAKSSRRTLNNILIFTILCFITLFNLPSMLRKQLLQSESKKNHAKIVSLLPKSFDPKVLYFSQLILSNENNQWKSNIPLSVSAKELVNRWLTLSGTRVDERLLAKLKTKLNQPLALRIEHEESAQPYHLTYYQAKEFWLMQNWRGQWLAVSVDQHYLMPLN